MPTVLVCGALLGGHFYYYSPLFRRSAHAYGFSPVPGKAGARMGMDAQPHRGV